MISINLKANNLYRLNIDQQFAEEKSLDIPFVDVYVPDAIDKASIEAFIFGTNEVEIGNISFSTTIPGISYTASFNSVQSTGAYTNGSKTKQTTSVVKFKSASYTGFVASGNDKTPSNFLNGAIQFTYKRGSTVQTDTGQVSLIEFDPQTSDMYITATFTSSVNAAFTQKTVAKVREVVTNAQNPFKLKFEGATGSFCLVKAIDNTVPETIKNWGLATGSGVLYLDASTKSIPAQTNTKARKEKRYAFSFDSTSFKKLAKYPTIVDVAIPIWRYQDFSNNISIWYLASWNDSSSTYYIPLTSSFSNNTYTINTENYIAITNTPPTTTQVYQGYNTSSVAGPDVLQPIKISGSRALVSDDTYNYGSISVVELILYPGFSDSINLYKNIDMAFIIARYKKENSSWIASKWVNVHPSVLSVRTTDGITQNIGSLGSANQMSKDLSSQVIIFDSSGAQRNG
jgi:hypothetical protein